MRPTSRANARKPRETQCVRVSRSFERGRWKMQNEIKCNKRFSFFRYDVRGGTPLRTALYVTVSRVWPQQVDQVHGEVAQREHDHDRHQHLRRFPPGLYLSHRAHATRGRRPVKPCNEIAYIYNICARDKYTRRRGTFKLSFYARAQGRIWGWGGEEELGIQPPRIFFIVITNRIY